MAKQTIDPGIGEKFNARTGRVLNKDGSFNVQRSGFDIRRIHIFHYLVRISWLRFFIIMLCAFAIANMLFAWVYLMLGDGTLKSTDLGSRVGHFWECVFFSVHTMTTVGYGNLYPSSFAANAVAGLEAMTGLLGFSVATGMVYGRFSRPTAKITYSQNAIVTPFQSNQNALMFRIANLRDSIMMDVEATALLTFIEKRGEQYIRQYFGINFVRNKVSYLPLTWTLVHVIDEQSPLFGKSNEEQNKMMYEIMITVKGFDETYGNTVHSRFSYLSDDIVWGARFSPAFHVQKNGAAILDINKLNLYEKAELNPIQAQGVLSSS